MNKILEQNKLLLRNLMEDSLNSELHFLFGLSHLLIGNLYIANAELRTAKTLGYDAQVISEQISIVFQQFGLNYKPGKRGSYEICQNYFMENIDHNQYFRIKTLADYICAIKKSENISVLDIGGGEGKLAFFLPDNDYCLVEPNVNGISGTNLPFSEDSFDIVIACHVLEHIPERQRNNFLDQLCEKAKSDVLLLNPFQDETELVNDSLELVLEITGAGWAKEHLDCGLPNIEYVRSYALSKGYDCLVQPNGTMAMTYIVELLQYYAMKVGCSKELQKINRLLNDKYFGSLTSKNCPNAHLIHLKTG